jgi:integrase
MAVDEGRLARNVAKLVKPPEYACGARDTWSQAEVRAFLTAAANDRLHAAWRLTIYGLRRGEVLGLRWSDVDLKARTLTVSQGRVLVDYRIYVEPPKTRNGQRTLPLDDALVAALLALRKHLAKESEEAASAYEAALPDLDWYTAGDRYIVADQLGTPVHPRVVLRRVRPAADPYRPAQDSAARFPPHDAQPYGEGRGADLGHQ